MAKVLRSALCAAMLAATTACVNVPHAGADADRSGKCVGAAALANGCAPTESGGFKPTADKAGTDYRGNGNKEGCWTDLSFKNFKSCSFGSKKAKYTVALVGNSHMAQYLRSFTGWTDKHDLRIVTFLIPQCFATNARIDFSHRKDGKGLTARCHQWGQWAHAKAAALKPDLIMTSERTYREPVDPLPEGKNATWRKGYREYLSGWVWKGLRVTVIRDNPVPEFDVPKCLKRNPRRYSACAGAPATWLPPDPVVQAAESLDHRLIDVIDLSRYMCTDSRCPAVIGGLSVYRDHSHMTGTWIAAVDRYLEGPFMKALTRR